LSNVTQRIVLSGAKHYGERLPPQAVGQTLVAIPNLVRQSVDMVFRGQSIATGKRPGWLTAASDLWLVGVSGGEESVLTFEAPTLGDAAPELFRQGEFPWTSRPNPDDTGFDLLGDVLSDVATANSESERFDARLLIELWGTRTIFKRAYSDLTLISQRHGAHDPAILNSATLVTAKQLYDTTPRPQAAMIVGKLDMIRDSTQTFALIMEDGQEVRCMMAKEEVETLTPLFKHRVAVSGRAVFRASGRLLRLEAESVRDAAPSDRFFARVPKPNAQRYDPRRALKEQSHKRGVAAIIGKWPGDESDEQIDEWLEEMS
jgi:hypothetical protein